MNLVDSVIGHEGFRSRPYQDHLGNWTFGHGLTWISPDESRRIVSERLLNNEGQLLDEKPWLAICPGAFFDVVIEMSFQMGVSGVLNFERMFEAAADEDHAKAADEMTNSLWARQTPERAKELSDIVRGLA
ncbi:MAG: glycoside hydrolase family protein [Oleispira sp.]|nr:glycoside hydrolase family protein [Oleispira sp.]